MLVKVLSFHFGLAHCMDVAWRQDWTWVAGSHVLSCTAKGYEVSSFQTDAIARSYMVTALDESIEILNAGISLLSKEGTCIHQSCFYLLFLNYFVFLIIVSN